MRRIGAAIFFCVLSAGAFAGDFRIEDRFRSCSSEDRYDCRSNQKQLKSEFPRAMKGDYQAQRNVSYCLSSGCGGSITVDKMLGCAWRIVVLASGSSKLDNADQSNFQHFCSSGLTNDDRAIATAQARRLFHAIYRRDMADGPWIPVMRPPALPPVDLGSATSFGDRFNREGQRIGFDVLPVASTPSCARGPASTSCSMRIGASVGVVIGTDETGETARDLVLLKAAGADGAEWINTLTTLIMLFEPDARPVDVKSAIEAIHAPLLVGKTEFSTAHDMPRTRLTGAAGPLIGLMITFAPR
jgi:hypothetical protein